MKIIKMLTVITTASGIFAASNSFAVSVSPYVSAKGGYGFAKINDSLDNIDLNIQPDGINYSAAAGLQYDFNNFAIRGEFEFANANYKDESITDISASFGIPVGMSVKNNQKITSGFANIYADFLTNYNIKPYIGGGIGYASVKNVTDVSMIFMGTPVNNIAYDYRDDKTAYSISTGFGFNITNSLSADLGAKYILIPNMTNMFGNSVIQPTNAEIFTGTIGLKYKF